MFLLGSSFQTKSASVRTCCMFAQRAERSARKPPHTCRFQNGTTLSPRRLIRNARQYLQTSAGRRWGWVRNFFSTPLEGLWASYNEISVDSGGLSEMSTIPLTKCLHPGLDSLNYTEPLHVLCCFLKF